MGEVPTPDVYFTTPTHDALIAMSSSHALLKDGNGRPVGMRVVLGRQGYKPNNQAQRDIATRWAQEGVNNKLRHGAVLDALDDAAQNPGWTKVYDGPFVELHAGFPCRVIAYYAALPKQQHREDLAELRVDMVFPGSTTDDLLDAAPAGKPSNRVLLYTPYAGFGRHFGIVCGVIQLVEYTLGGLDVIVPVLNIDRESEKPHNVINGLNSSGVNTVFYG